MSGPTWQAWAQANECWYAACHLPGAPLIRLEIPAFANPPFSGRPLLCGIHAYVVRAALVLGHELEVWEAGGLLSLVVRPAA